MKFLRLKAITKKELIHVVRDPRSLGLAIFIPIVLLTLFGFALTLDVDNVPLAVWNQDKSRVSADFILNFKNSRYFKIIGYFEDYATLQNYIDTKKAMMALVIPKDFAKLIRSAQAAPVQLLVDGSDSNTATLAMGYANSVVNRYNINLITESLSKAGVKKLPAIDLSPRVWFNEDLKSRNYIIPGLIAVIMMIIAALLTSLTIAREWEQGTMEQLISTPVGSDELIFGKFIPYFIIGFFDVLVAVAMAQFVFHVPLKGSLTLLLFASSIFLTGGLGMGIYISAATRNQRLATQIAVLSTFLPTFLLSGFIYPIYNMPKAIQAVTFLIPARYFIIMLKGIYLKGEGLGMLLRPMVLLSFFAWAMVFLAKRKFKKKVA